MDCDFSLLIGRFCKFIDGTENFPKNGLLLRFEKLPIPTLSALSHILRLQVIVLSNSHQAVPHNWIRASRIVVTLALLFGCADVVLNRLAFGHGWSILLPLNGITVALLLMQPKRSWLVILIGAAVGTGLGDALDGQPLSLVVGEQLCSTLEVLLTVQLLPSFRGLDQWLRKPSIFLRLLAAILIGPGVSGIVAALLLHHHQGQSYLVGFSRWAIPDALGMAASMPFALALRSREMRHLFQLRALPKTVAVLTVVISVAVLGFGQDRYPLLFLLYPALLFVDALLAFSGSALAMVGTCLIAVSLATHGYGPFGDWPAGLHVSRDGALQIFLGFHVLALFPASMLSLDRRRMAEELSDSNAQLRTLAALDALTGLCNRRSLDEKFSYEWNRAIRQETPLALIMMDIDHFKQYNDLYGHHAGDQCLQAVATALSTQICRIQDHVSRFGGEEFALVLPNTELKGAHIVAEKVRTAVFALEIEHQGSSWGRVTVSVGCSAVTPLQGEDRFALLELADVALYRAKHSGRNCVKVSSLNEEFLRAMVTVGEEAGQAS